MFAAVSSHAADPDISFNPAITPVDFQKFSHVLSQALYADPVGPARADGVLHFDAGIAATVVNVDSGAGYWKNAVGSNSTFTTRSYIGVPRLVVTKGFGSGTIFGSYAKITDSGIKTYGGGLDIPIIRGGIATPEVAVRGVYSRVTGSSVYRLKTYGAEAFISKGFGPLTPYASIGRMRSNADGDIPATSATKAFTISDRSDFNRYSVGVRISLLVPKITLQVTQGVVRSYAAKVSIGF